MYKTKDKTKGLLLILRSICGQALLAKLADSSGDFEAPDELGAWVDSIAPRHDVTGAFRRAEAYAAQIDQLQALLRASHDSRAKFEKEVNAATEYSEKQRDLLCAEVRRLTSELADLSKSNGNLQEALQFSRGLRVEIRRLLALLDGSRG